MEKSYFFNKTLAIVILLIFVGAGFSPVIRGDLNNEKDFSSLTFYTFGRSETNKCKVELPTDIVKEISNMFTDLKNKMIYDPISDQTQKLKDDFANLLAINNLIPGDLSKEDLISVLNPKWLNFAKNYNPFIKHSVIPRLGSNLRDKLIPNSFSNFGSAAFCSIAGGGKGFLFPPVMFPRPRIVNFWNANSDGLTTAANLFTGNGFLAGGAQVGVTLGFMGVGLTWAVAGKPAYFGFGGYALFAMVGADEVETYPLNREPTITDESPKNGQMGVSLSLSELSFIINDPDGDRMSYWVTTEPDIGSGEGHMKKNGRYSVSIDDLETDKPYIWNVRVSDGNSIVEKTFNFITISGPPFDPFNEGWQYQKKIVIDHSLVAGDLSVFPMVVNVVDPDLKDKAQADGDDILFMDGPGVANKMYHEIERYDSNNGLLAAWVGIPSLSGSADTEFYIYYGNPTCSNNENAFGVWDGYFEAVWHLSDNGNQIDSTGNGHTLFPTKAPDYKQEASIGYSCYFDGVNDEFFEGSAVITDYPLTSEAYGIIDRNDHSMVPVGICDYSGYDVLSNIYFRSSSGDYNLRAQSRDNSGQPNPWAITTNTYSLNIPQYMVARHSSKSSREAWLNDGSGIGKDTTTVTITDIDNIAVGCHKYRGYSNGYYHFFGWIDEVRVSSIARSNNWLKTTYNSFDSAFDGGFFSLGPEETSP